MRSIVALAFVGLGVTLGCGGEQVEPAAPGTDTVVVTPPATPATTAEAPEPAASAAPKAAPSGSAAASAGAASEASSGSKRAPAHWKDFPGPKSKAAALSTPKAWAVVPVGLDGKFDIVKIALQEYGKPAGEEQLLIQFDKSEMYVPAGLVRPTAPAKGLAKGDAMMVNVAAASGFGRVTAIEKGDEGERVKFKYDWGGSVSEEDLPLDQVVKLEDKVAFGHPVAVKDGERWVLAQCIYTDATTSWVISFGGSPTQVATRDLKPLKVAKPLAKGAKVSAYGNTFQFAPGKVVEVLEGGAQYKVKFDAGKEETLALEKVSAPL